MSKMRSYPLFVLYLLLIMGLSSCGSNRNSSALDIASIYNSKKIGLRPFFDIAHQSDSISKILYRIDNKDLLFTQSVNRDYYTASYKISYILSNSSHFETILDSGSIKKQTEQARAETGQSWGDFLVRTPPEEAKKYYVFITIKDLNRGNTYQNYLILDKSDFLHGDYFSLKDTSNQLIYSSFVAPNTPFRVKHSLFSSSVLYVKAYFRDFPLAMPPYSNPKEESFEIKPDSLFEIHSDSICTLNKPGFYQFSLSKEKYKGITVYCFSNSFPLVGDFKQMAGPLRYLTTQKEYDALMAVYHEPSKLRKEVEKFWLKRTGSKEKSRNLIASFYQRAEEANRLFSSHVEGWRTDRGILYIIYGPPDRVYRFDNGEFWSYGNQNSSLSYNFNFQKIENPFSDNDYQLERNPSYRYGWGQAVSAWRRGHVYDSNDIKQEQDAQDQLQYRAGNPYWY